MNTNRLQTIGNQFQDGANEAAQTARDAVQTAAAAAKEAANSTSDVARDAYQAARAKAGDLYEAARTKTGETLKDVREQVDQTTQRTTQYVSQHPMSSLLGAIAFGAGVGALAIFALRRPEPSFRRRYVEEPLDTARDAIYAVLEPVVKRLQSSCETTRDGAGKALDGVQQFKGARAVDSVSDHLRHLADSLKFW